MTVTFHGDKGPYNRRVYDCYTSSRVHGTVCAILCIHLCIFAYHSGVLVHSFKSIMYICMYVASGVQCVLIHTYV